LAQAIALALVLIGWQIGAGIGLSAYYLSTPVQVAEQIYAWLLSGYLWPHLLATLESTVTGFLIASVAGICLALAMASSPRAAKIVEPLFFAAFSTPKIVIAPLLILWVGVGHLPVIALATLSSFFIIFYGAYGGLRDVSRSYIDTAAVLGAGRWTTAFQFRLPAAGPHILSGLQQGLIYAFHGAILGEMTASDTGMGYVIVYGATSMDSSAVLAALVVIGAVSFGLIQLLGRATRHWADPLTIESIA
jgi:NitT/TauT family transport system permease protein